MRTIDALRKRQELSRVRHYLSQCREWVDNAPSEQERLWAQRLEWQAMKEEACLEQKATSHRLTFVGSTMRRM